MTQFRGFEALPQNLPYRGDNDVKPTHVRQESENCNNQNRHGNELHSSSRSWVCRSHNIVLCDDAVKNGVLTDDHYRELLPD